MSDAFKCLPGVAFWLLVSTAAGVSFHRGHINELVFGFITVFAFAVGVAINLRGFEGKP